MIVSIIASSKEWFKDHPKSKEYKELNLIEISNKEDLNLEYLEKINPRYIFFPHWNWRVNSEIYERFDCVAFHTAPLPYGRGGSPIQNLILKGFKNSPVCALKMTDILDGGPIYDSFEVSLNGTISEIFSKIAICVERLIIIICQNNTHPIEQKGEVLEFKRLLNSNNELLGNFSINELYDRIRMVDGLDYPRAFINYGNYKIEFSEAYINGSHLKASVKIVPNI